MTCQAVIELVLLPPLALCSQLPEDVDGGDRSSCVLESELALAGITLSQLISDHFPDLFG